MTVQERLGLVVSLILTGLALYFIIDLPARAIGLPWGIAIQASTRLLMAVLLGALAFTGAGAVVHGYPHRRTGYTTPFWVNATLVVVFATLTLAQLGSVAAWGIGLAVTGLLLWVALLAEHHIAGQLNLQPARFGSQIISYALMPAYATLIYQTDMGIVTRMVALGLVSILLASSVIRLYAPAGKSIWVYASLVAAGVMQIAWAIVYWPLNAVGSALVALMVLYGFNGVIAAHLKGTLSRWVIAEYAFVAGASLVLSGWLGRL